MSASSLTIPKSLNFSTADEKMVRKDSIEFSDIPTELHSFIATFLDSKEIIGVLQRVSKQFRDLVLDSYVWKLVEESRSLPIDVRIRKISCIAERRSKGKLFKGIDRLTGQKCTVRKIYLDVTNAGTDDGFPTSVLRELSHLKSLDSPYVTK